MPKVLVTGGAGFIGSHLVDALVTRGDEVLVVDNLTPQVHRTKPGYLNAKATYRFEDLRQPDVVRQALADSEVVYHLASAVGTGQSMYQIEDYVAANSLVTARLLQRLVDDDTDVRRLVVASSMSIYGEGAYRCATCGVVSPGLRPDEQLGRHEWELRCPNCGRTTEPIPTPESKPLAPASVYAITKRDQEEMCIAVGRAYGIPAVGLRFFNVYGPRQALSNPYTGVCAVFQSRIQNGKAPIIFEDGRQTRDFVSVHDVVRALVLAGERSQASYQAINVGTGRPTSVLDIGRTLMKIYGTDLALRPENTYRQGDVRHCFADTSRARASLGYEPDVSLEDGLREFIAWSRSEVAEDRTDEAYRELRSRGLTGA